MYYIANRNMCDKVLIAAILLTFSIIFVASQNPNESFKISDTCMECICHASSQCDLSIGCKIVGKTYLCGPFLISKPYWIDAGMPVIRDDDPNVDGAFERCVVDKFCAARCVENYMRNFTTDCNRNFIDDCEDYARIHVLGEPECSNDAAFNQHRHFVRRLQKCSKVEASATLSDETLNAQPNPSNVPNPVAHPSVLNVALPDTDVEPPHHADVQFPNRDDEPAILTRPIRPVIIVNIDDDFFGDDN